MPTLSFFYGIKITMYWNDHPPPHFHATAEGQVVVIDIGTLTVLWGEISVRHLRLVLEWAKLHQAELMEAWELCSNQQAPHPITPLP